MANRIPAELRRQLISGAITFSVFAVVFVCYGDLLSLALCFIIPWGAWIDIAPATARGNLAEVRGGV